MTSLQILIKRSKSRKKHNKDVVEMRKNRISIIEGCLSLLNSSFLILPIQNIARCRL